MKIYQQFINRTSCSSFCKWSMFALFCSLSMSLFGQVNDDDPLGAKRKLIMQNEIFIGFNVQIPNDDFNAHFMESFEFNGTNTLVYKEQFGLYGQEGSFVAYDPLFPDYTCSFTGGGFGEGSSDISTGYLYADPANPEADVQSVITAWVTRDDDFIYRPVFGIKVFDAYNLSTSPSCSSTSVTAHGPAIAPYVSGDLASLGSSGIPSVRVGAGNIISDPANSFPDGEDEIVFAYTDDLGKIIITLFEPNLTCWDKDPSCGGADYYVPFADQITHLVGPSYDTGTSKSKVMDLTVNDFNMDGIDDIALAVIHTDGTLWVHVYYYNEVSNQLEEKYSSEIEDPYKVPCCSSSCSFSSDVNEFQVVINSGEYFPEFLGNEIIVGTYFQSSNLNNNSVSLYALREDPSTGTALIHNNACTDCGGSCTESDYLFYRQNNVGSFGIDRFDIASGDLTGTSEDEAIMVFNSQARVFDFSLTQNDEMKINDVHSFTVSHDQNNPNQEQSGRYAHSYIDIGNIHSITSAVNATDLSDELLVVTNDAQFDSNQELTSQTLKVELYEFQLTNGLKDITIDPILLASRDLFEGEFLQLHRHSACFVDIDGGSVSLGEPTSWSMQDVVTPIVTMNAPPSHFDVFNTDTLDINNLYASGLETNPNDNFQSKMNYTETTASSTSFSTTVNKDWALSASISVGFEAPVAKVSGTFTKTFGEKFSNSGTESKTVTFSSTNSAIRDDRIIGYRVDYDVFEYPIILSGNTDDTLSYAVVVVPTYPSGPPENFSQQDVTNDYQKNHQHGNLFSFAHDTEDLQLVDEHFWALSPIDIDNGLSFGNSRSVEIVETTESSLSREKFNNHSFEAEAGFAAKGVSVSASVKGEYNQSQISTRETSVSTSKDFEIKFGTIENGLLPFSYNVKPFLFWDINGSVVMDYTVEMNNLSGELWNQYYNGYDPAFNLEKIHDPEKGIIATNDESRRYRTKEIRFNTIPIPGIDITIFTRIQNFGLVDLPANVPVCFYYNTESDESLQLIDCTSTSTILESRVDDLGREILSVDWTIPNHLTAAEKVKIVAIIDPENVFSEEIHDYPTSDGISNNVAWNCLYGVDCGIINDVSQLFFDPCANIDAVLTLNMDPIPSATYYASNKIIVGGKIPDGNTVTLVAPNGVEFLASFDIELGAEMETISETCQDQN